MTGTDLRIRRITISALFVPLACVVICGSYVFRANTALGYWPTYGNPDPKQLGWAFHHALVLLSVMLVPPALLFCAISGSWLIYRRIRIAGASILILSVLLWLGVYLLGHSPWGDEFFAWYLD
jgi:hypothetical protein